MSRVTPMPAIISRVVVPPPPPEMDMAPKTYFGGKAPVALPWHPLPHMDEYLTELATSEQPRASGYIKPIKVGLAHFAAFCIVEDIKHPGEIKREHLLRFQAYLTTTVRSQLGEPLSLAYRQQLMKYVRGWINWLEEVQHIVGNPWYAIKVGRVAKVPKPLEDDEIGALFSAHRSGAFSITPFYFHRREVILVLLFAWGLRIHELQALNVANMDARLNAVTVRNKGGGSKQMPYGSEVKLVVQRWLNVRSQHGTYADDALLIDSQGGRLSIQMMRRIVTECGTRAGLSMNPHRLRDSFGTTMMDHDVQVEHIMKLMGHTQRSQTLAYARINDPKLLQSHERVMSPLVAKLLSG